MFSSNIKMMKNKILIISAHPDDEVLGCGGTVAKHSLNGERVEQIFVSDGESARDKISIKNKQKTINSRLHAAKKAAKILGIKNTTSINFPDNRLDSIPLLEIVKELEKKISQFKPSIIYTHSDLDLNIDHQIVSRAVMTACRPINNLSVKEIYFFEVLSSSEWEHKSKESFLPNYFVDISKTINLKIKAFKSYKKEIKKYPHSRSIEGIKVLSQYRGMMVGVKNAESFFMKRKIN
tara:strand:+ start:527 stop:1234 length:708 start_codon:yes stop_codon:yes gene_type:complete